jgi:hypothetical protein
VYSHIKEVINEAKKVRIFPRLELNAWPASNPHKKSLHFGMVLCNEFQHIRMHNKATYTVDDMAAIAKASQSVPQRGSPGPGPNVGDPHLPGALRPSRSSLRESARSRRL